MTSATQSATTTTTVDTDRPIVLTEGGSVRGTTSRREGVSVFKGIPFAAPPVGDLRWRAPQPAQPWEGVREADSFGAVCPQTPETGLPNSEDCLYLNVWTPGADDARRPVLVWIYGGRFIFGHGSDPQYDGAAIAAQDVVVVTMNYRTGAFGFMVTDELSEESGHGTSGNYGLLDQRAALQWVQRNIARFGGDPDRVTIAGQSAGAACVMAHVYSPLSQGLVHGAIAESGALFPRDPSLAYLAAAYRQHDAALAEGRTWMAEHGVSTLAEMRALPVESLMQGNDADEEGPGGHRPPLFRPVLDGWMFPRTYEESLRSGEHADVPVLTGTNLDEDGASPKPRVTVDEFVAHAREVYGEFADEFLALYPATTDEEAGAQSNASARDHSRTSSNLWAQTWLGAAAAVPRTYFWTHTAPGPDAEERGAFHGSEVFYVLDTLDVVDRPWTDEDRRIATILSTYVANFVRSGDPNGDGLPDWAAYREGDPVTMQLGDAFEPLAVAEPAKFDFFRRFLEAQPAR